MPSYERLIIPSAAKIYGLDPLAASSKARTFNSLSRCCLKKHPHLFRQDHAEGMKMIYGYVLFHVYINIICTCLYVFFHYFITRTYLNVLMTL